MKRQVKVLKENDKFVGVVMVDGETVYKTPPQDNPNTTASMLGAYINKTPLTAAVVATSNSSPATPVKSFVPVAVPSTAVQQPTSPTAVPVKKRCCGRG
jgi:hypothetical protein